MTQASVPFDTVLSNALAEPAQAQAYLDVAFAEFQEDGDLAFFLTALRNVAQAQGGLAALADKSQLNRQNLYKALSPQGNPRLGTVSVLLKSMGLRLSVQALSPAGH
jgi:probable addiction module antidote protein